MGFGDLNHPDKVIESQIYNYLLKYLKEFLKQHYNLAINVQNFDNRDKRDDINR